MATPLSGISTARGVSDADTGGTASTTVIGIDCKAVCRAASGSSIDSISAAFFLSSNDCKRVFAPASRRVCGTFSDAVIPTAFTLAACKRRSKSASFLWETCCPAEPSVTTTVLTGASDTGINTAKRVYSAYSNCCAPGRKLHPSKASPSRNIHHRWLVSTRIKELSFCFLGTQIGSFHYRVFRGANTPPNFGYSEMYFNHPA